MPDLIDPRPPFIAQPPLYKVTRGKSEQYLKDERALENYLIDTGIEEAVLGSIPGSTVPARTCASWSRMRIIRNVLNGL